MYEDTSIWNGNLRNTSFDIFVDTVLFVLIVCSYIPQITRLRNTTSTRGISASHVLFNVFFSNAQLSFILLGAALAWPTNPHSVIRQINDGTLKGAKAFGGILGLLQSFAQWSCSILVLVSFVARSRADGSTSRTIGLLVAACLHAAAVLFTVVKITLPVPAKHSIGTAILIGLITMSDEIVAPCFAILQCCSQYREMRLQGGYPGAFSLFSVVLQILTIAFLGLRWFLRIGPPTSGGRTGHSLYEYFGWAFPALNYLIHAAGNIFLLACYSYRRADRGTTTQYDGPEDRRPLLG